MKQLPKEVTSECPECVGTMRLTTREPWIWDEWNGVDIWTPKDVPVYVCESCGEHELPAAAVALVNAYADALKSKLRPRPAPQADLHHVPAPKRRQTRTRLVTVKCGYKSSTSLVTLRPDRTYLLRLPHPAPTLSTLTAESRRLSRYVSPGRSVRKESV